MLIAGEILVTHAYTSQDTSYTASYVRRPYRIDGNEVQHCELDSSTSFQSSFLLNPKESTQSSA